jgi:DNA-binding MarR family transcriptional regulator
MADLWSHDGVTQKELGMSLIKNKSSITKMLKALEDEGLIVKKDHPQDKRNKLIFLTSKGSKLQDFVEKSGKTIEKLLMVDVPEDNIEIAKEVLKDFYLLLSSKSTIQNQNHEKNYS